MAAKVIDIIIKEDIGDGQEFMIDHWLEFKVHAIDSKMRASPIRLLSAVIIPAPKDRGLE